MEFHGDDDYTEQITFSRQDVADIPEVEKRLSVWQRILALLKDGSFYPKEIAEMLDVNENNVNVNLHRLKKKGKVIKLTDDKYGLAYEE